MRSERFRGWAASTTYAIEADDPTQVRRHGDVQIDPAVRPLPCVP